jgi:hypothetical protein
MVFQLLRVTQRGQRAFAAEAVQAPEHDQVEGLQGLQQQGLESSAARLAPDAWSVYTL